MVDTSFNPAIANEIPEEVLQNYHNRTVKDAKNPRWVDAAHTIVDMDVLFSELSPMGYVPFTTMSNADTNHGVELWIKSNAGEYGPIADFVDPTLEQIREQMPDLERWRVNTIIDLEPGLREKIDAAIEAMPEPQRTISKNKLSHVQMFRRKDVLFEMIGSVPAIGKTPEDIDAMWEAGAALT